MATTRTERMAFRVTAAERRMIEQSARRNGDKVSDWIRLVLLSMVGKRGVKK